MFSELFSTIYESPKLLLGLVNTLTRSGLEFISSLLSENQSISPQECARISENDQLLLLKQCAAGISIFFGSLYILNKIIPTNENEADPEPITPQRNAQRAQLQIHSVNVARQTDNDHKSTKTQQKVLVSRDGKTKLLLPQKNRR